MSMKNSTDTSWDGTSDLPICSTLTAVPPRSHICVCKKVNQSHYRSEMPRGFQEVEAHKLRDNGPGWW